jgi:hypothetical protein
MGPRTAQRRGGERRSGEEHSKWLHERRWGADNDASSMLAGALDRMPGSAKPPEGGAVAARQGWAEVCGITATSHPWMFGSHQPTTVNSTKFSRTM